MKVEAHSKVKVGFFALALQGLDGLLLGGDVSDHGSDVIESLPLDSVGLDFNFELGFIHGSLRSSRAVLDWTSP
jgi:hypothetical protein